MTSFFTVVRTRSALTVPVSFIKSSSAGDQSGKSQEKENTLSDRDDSHSFYYYSTCQASFSFSKNMTATYSSTTRRWLQRLVRYWQMEQQPAEQQQLNFSFDFNKQALGPATKTTTGVLLVHPIGVGIGKWFYDRLLYSLQSKYNEQVPRNTKSLLLLAPDLIGSGTGCNPVVAEDGSEIGKLPLLNISDWSDQLVQLMADIETEHSAISNWCVVANGGCSPIALQVAQRAVEGTAPFQQNVTHVILSSVPGLPFFLPSWSEPQRVHRSYRTLCGLPGRLFWWYACRNNGAFIQKFSERNLVADPSHLGDQWTSNCVQTARMQKGKSRYSTFAFLAGTLQDGCRKSLDVLKGSDVSIDFIKSRDGRRNRARSWFWQKRKKVRTRNEASPDETQKTIRDFVQRNGNGGRQIMIGGRISLAHEDAPGYASAVLKLISSG